MTQSTKPSKAATLRQMLQSRSGACMAKICETTGWQAHSVRAAISGLRKTGYVVERRAETKAGSGAIYKITAKPAAG